jgi:hypothetical protein
MRVYFFIYIKNKKNFTHSIFAIKWLKIISIHNKITRIYNIMLAVAKLREKLRENQYIKIRLDLKNNSFYIILN